jgi:hypothetical protein
MPDIGVDSSNEKDTTMLESTTRVREESNVPYSSQKDDLEVEASEEDAGANAVIEPEQPPEAVKDTQTVEGNLSKDQGPEDKNYSSFTLFQKRSIVLGATFGAFFSPVTAQIYFPALPQIATELNVNSSKINLTITTYMVCINPFYTYYQH